MNRKFFIEYLGYDWMRFKSLKLILILDRKLMQQITIFTFQFLV